MPEGHGPEQPVVESAFDQPMHVTSSGDAVTGVSISLVGQSAVGTILVTDPESGAINRVTVAG